LELLFFTILPLPKRRSRFQQEQSNPKQPALTGINQGDSMDVHCTTCGEPWDVYHLRHDAIFETGLTHAEAKAWGELSPSLRLNNRYREKFRAIGYEFGGSVLNVTRCPACPKEAKPDPDKAVLKAGIVEILGDDEDAIASTLAEHGL
jgi:hypothetical protein